MIFISDRPGIYLFLHIDMLYYTKGQSRTNNPGTLITMGTQDTIWIQTKQKTQTQKKLES